MSFATEATAPSDVVRRISDACVKEEEDGTPNVTARPLPMNRTARRAFDARRAATKSTGTSAWAKSLSQRLAYATGSHDSDTLRRGT